MRSDRTDSRRGAVEEPAIQSAPVGAGTPYPRASWRQRLGVLGKIPTPAIFIGSIVIALLVLWWQGELGRIAGVIGDASAAPLLIAAPVYVASLWLLCYRWHALVRMAQGRSNLPRAAEAFLTSVVINYAAPIGLAVPSRAALTKRALGLDAHATGTIALWEILADVLVLGAGSVLWFLLADGALGSVREELAASASLYLLAVATGAVLLGGICVWAYRKPTIRGKLMHATGRILLAPRHRPVEAALALLVSAVYWVIQGLVLALLVRAMNLDPSFEFILGLTSVPILVGMLSPIPGGAVIREALMYVVARIAGVPGSEVVAAAVIYRFALFGAIPILYLLTRIWIGRTADTSINASGTASKETIDHHNGATV